MESYNKVMKLQGSNVIVSMKGPNINKKFTMDIPSFRPKLLSPIPSAALVASRQRPIRDTCPTASIGSDLEPRNFHQLFNPRDYSERSVYNDRAVSPVSMRDSTASYADMIINAIKRCPQDEWPKIWHAVNREHEFRKKALNRRKTKTSLENHEIDEGEQGSRFSITYDDCASTEIECDPHCEESNPQSVNSYDCPSEDRSNNRGCSGYAPSPSHNPPNSTYCPFSILPYQKTSKFGSMYSSNSKQSMTLMSQRDRFRSGFPSPRFNRSPLYEEREQVRNQFPLNDCANRGRNLQKDHIDQLSDDSYDIFLDTPVKPKTSAAPYIHTNNKNVRDIVNVNHLNDKHNKDTVNTNNKLSKDIPKNIVAGAPRMDTLKVDSMRETNARTRRQKKIAAMSENTDLVATKTSKKTNSGDTKSDKFDENKKYPRTRRQKKIAAMSENIRDLVSTKTSKKTNSGDPITNVRTRRQRKIAAMSENIRD